MHTALVVFATLLIFTVLFYVGVMGALLTMADNRQCQCKHKLKQHEASGPCTLCLCRRFIPGA